VRRIILGISAYYHDSAAVLLIDGKIAAAAQEERFTRKKHDPSFPTNAAKYVLEESGLDLSDVTMIAFYDKPFLKFERLLETYHAFAPRGFVSFLTAIPVWIKEKLFMKRLLKQHIAELGEGMPPIVFPEHHLSHAASAFYPSPFDDAAILTIDGVGEWATTTISHGRGKDITILKELHFPHSVGLLYSAFTFFSGFRVNSGEYKLMGLAPYGNPNSERVADFKKKIKDVLVDIREDGSILLNMDYFNYATGLKMIDIEKWNELFGVPCRKAESEKLEQAYMDLALAIQQVTEEIVLMLCETTAKLTGSKSLVLAGGVALNCVVNGKILDSGLFEEMWIQPAAGDAGGALGAALAVWHIIEGEGRVANPNDSMEGSYLGPQFDDADVEKVICKYEAKAKRYEDFSGLAQEVAERIDRGDAVGWFQGRMEFGPRALGNRSILGDARNPEMQKKLNLKIKYREGFRPFAPSVLEEDVPEHFDLASKSPYMLLVRPVDEAKRIVYPDDYWDQELYDRLYFCRSDLPAITHIDYSARIQSVSKSTNDRYWRLIDAFKQLTGYGVVVNTSFNVRGEPIVCTPSDAYRCFMRTEMDCLVIGNYVFEKTRQPHLDGDKNWQSEFTLD